MKKHQTHSKRLIVNKNALGVIHILIVWLLDWLMKTHHEVDFKCKARVIFSSIVINGVKIIGELKKMRVQKGQFFDVEVKPQTSTGEDADYQVGTGSFTLGGAIDGVSVSAHPDDPENELRCRVTVDEDAEFGSEVLEFRADADPDEGETREIVGTLAFTVARPETEVFTLQASTPQDIEPEEPENPEDGDGVEDDQ